MESTSLGFGPSVKTRTGAALSVALVMCLLCVAFQAQPVLSYETRTRKLGHVAAGDNGEWRLGKCSQSKFRNPLCLKSVRSRKLQLYQSHDWANTDLKSTEVMKAHHAVN
jgi:hypothetical protein